MVISIEPLEEKHFEKLYVLFDSICREKKFMVRTEAGSQETTFAYYRGIINSGHIHFVAIAEEQIIGWCDIVPRSGQTQSHIGVLGIGIDINFRGKGIGRKLIELALDKARERGLNRIELTVHSENKDAQALYKKVGFKFEGTQHHGWYLDGKYSDVYYMGRVT